MQLARRIAGAFLTACMLLGAMPLRGIAALPPAFTLKTLANGLRVVVVEDHAAPVVQSAVWYRFGSLGETAGKTGLAHALEHMMFRGTPAISDSGLDDIAQRVGAQLNANTNQDYTHYYFVVPANQLDLTMQIEADRMQHLTISEAGWKIEKGAVLTEIDNALSQPVLKFIFGVQRAAFPNSNLGLTALGERADVAGATAADLRAYYERWYRPNNATLVITGDVTPSVAFASAERYFGAIPKKQLPALAQNAAAAVSGVTLEQKADFPFEFVDLAYAIPGEASNDDVAIKTAAGMMNNQRGEFYKALVQSRIALAAFTFPFEGLQGGLMHEIIVVAPGHTGVEARAAYDQALAKTLESGYPSDLFDAAKRAQLASSIYARDSITGLGDHIGYAVGVKGLDNPAAEDQRIAALTLADVNAAAKKYLAAPAVSGSLLPGGMNVNLKAPSGGTGASDDFSAREPSGKIVQAAWVKTALAKPSTLKSNVRPAIFRLPNGLKLLVQEVHTNSTVHIAGRIGQSPNFDPVGKTGLGDLTSMLLNFGSLKYDFTAQRKAIDDISAQLQLGANFSADGMAKDVDTLLDLLADGERHPAFADQFIEQQRTQVLAGISRKEQSPDYRAQRAFEKLLLPENDPELREPSLDEVKSITKDDLSAYAAQYFRPDLTTIAIVGDVHTADIKAKVERYFGDWRADGARPNVHLPQVPLPAAASETIEMAGDSISAHLGHPAPPRNADFNTLQLMMSILGSGGFDSRLMHEIRQKRGLVYGVSGKVIEDKERGRVEFTLSAAPKNLRPAIALLKSQILRMQLEPVGADELAKAKNKVVAGAFISEQSVKTVLSDVLHIGIEDLPADYYVRFADYYRKITAADVQRVAKTYLHPDHLIEVYKGPKL